MGELARASVDRSVYGGGSLRAGDRLAVQGENGIKRLGKPFWLVPGLEAPPK